MLFNHHYLSPQQHTWTWSEHIDVRRKYILHRIQTKRTPLLFFFCCCSCSKVFKTLHNPELMINTSFCIIFVNKINLRPYLATLIFNLNYVWTVVNDLLFFGHRMVSVFCFYPELFSISFLY